MALISVSCPHCHDKNVCKMGFSSLGKQRYLCREAACQRSFILNYTHNGSIPGIDKKIIDMAMNGSGIRDTSRVLNISQSTVIGTLKKRVSLK